MPIIYPPVTSTTHTFTIHNFTSYTNIHPSLSVYASPTVKS